MNSRHHGRNSPIMSQSCVYRPQAGRQSNSYPRHQTRTCCSSRRKTLKFARSTEARQNLPLSLSTRTATHEKPTRKCTARPEPETKTKDLAKPRVINKPMFCWFARAAPSPSFQNPGLLFCSALEPSDTFTSWQFVSPPAKSLFYPRPHHVLAVSLQP